MERTTKAKQMMMMTLKMMVTMKRMMTMKIMMTIAMSRGTNAEDVLVYYFVMS